MIKYTTTITTEVEKEYLIDDGVYYFQTLDEDELPEYWWKIQIETHVKFNSLNEIKTEKLCDYSDKCFIMVNSYTESDLPYHLRSVFENNKDVKTISPEDFEEKKSEILERLNNGNTK